MSTREHWSRRQLLRFAGMASLGGWFHRSPRVAAGEDPAHGPEIPPTGSASASASGSGLALSPGSAIQERPRHVPVVAECDLCVIGGSATGVFAAVAAARLGASVCLIENLGYLGGVATASLVNIWHSIFDTTFQRQIIGGLTTEIVDRLKKRGAVTVSQANVSRHAVFNPAELVMELDELVREAAVRPFLHTRFVTPVVQDDTVVAAILEDKSGRRAVRAKYFVDASGDGDLVAGSARPTRSAGPVAREDR
jgi:hypothetical protein